MSANKNTKRYNTLPRKVTRKEFNRFIAPHLSKPLMGPKPSISVYKIFNYVLYVLSTGMQWDQLKPYKNEIHWSNVYKWHNRWSKDGSYLNLLEGTVHTLKVGHKLKLERIHGDATNTVAEKGAAA